MTGELQEGGTSPETWANIIWGLMFLGPAAYFLTFLLWFHWFATEPRGSSWVHDPVGTGLFFVTVIICATFIEFISIIIAYVKRDKLAGTPFESHATSAIRTFWISLVGLLPSMIVPLIPLLVIWKTFRVVRGLYRAMGGKPIANPTGWF